MKESRSSDNQTRKLRRYDLSSMNEWFLDHPIILASNSPRRRELLAQAGIPFRVETTEVDETLDIADPPAFVMTLSERKAKAIGAFREKEIVIGADTVVVCDKRILTKPVDEEDAFAMLSSLSGRSHEVYTGVTILYGSLIRRFFECTKVIMYDNDESFLKNYIATGEPIDKAGAYGIQGMGALLVEGIEGDYSNVVGLPIARLYRELMTMYSLIIERESL